MKLNLKKPLVVFDLETTGLDIVKDRIIQISYIKVYPDGKEERGDYLVNLGCGGEGSAYIQAAVQTAF